MTPFQMLPAELLQGALLCLCALNYLIRRDILYPPFVFSAVWAFVVAVYLFSGVEFYALTWGAVAVFAGCPVVMSLGCCIGNRSFNKLSSTWFQQPVANPQSRKLLLLYCCLTFPLFLQDTIRLAGGLSLSATFFIQARDALVEAARSGETGYSSALTSTAPMFSVLVAWLMLIEEESRIIKAFAIALAVVMSVLTTGRVLLLQLLVGWAVIALLRHDRRSLRANRKMLIACAAAVLLLMSAITLLTKKETQNLTGKKEFSVVSEMAATYIAGPLPAFDYASQHPEEVVAVGRLQSFVRVPFPINVFTVYRPYYVAAGLTGCLLVFLIIGVIHGYLFYAATNGNRVAIFFMAYLYYALIFSNFTDAYGLVIRHFRVLAFALFYYLVLSRVPRITFRAMPRLVLFRNR